MADRTPEPDSGTAEFSRFVGPDEISHAAKTTIPPRQSPAVPENLLAAGPPRARYARRGRAETGGSDPSAQQTRQPRCEVGTLSLRLCPPSVGCTVSFASPQKANAADGNGREEASEDAGKGAGETAAKGKPSGGLLGPLGGPLEWCSGPAKGVAGVNFTLPGLGCCQLAPEPR